MAKQWNRAGTGENIYWSGSGINIYAVMCVGTDGKIVSLELFAEDSQPVAEKQVTDALVNSQPFQNLPDEYQSKRNVWMLFDWSEYGDSEMPDPHFGISGPYFSEKPFPRSLFPMGSGNRLD
ncbi:MAG: hypothetical protein ACYC4B_31640 [Pirellulaceae bacterium]